MQLVTKVSLIRLLHSFSYCTGQIILGTHLGIHMCAYAHTLHLHLLLYVHFFKDTSFFMQNQMKQTIDQISKGLLSSLLNIIFLIFNYLLHFFELIIIKIMQGQYRYRAAYIYTYIYICIYICIYIYILCCSCQFSHMQQGN